MHRHGPTAAIQPASQCEQNGRSFADRMSGMKRSAPSSPSAATSIGVPGDPLGCHLPMPATSRTFSTSSSSRPAGRVLSLVATTLGAEATALVCPHAFVRYRNHADADKVVKSSDDSFCTSPSCGRSANWCFTSIVPNPNRHPTNCDLKTYIFLDQRRGASCARIEGHTEA